jgi:hypothetical protein
MRKVRVQSFALSIDGSERFKEVINDYWYEAPT